jgi:hypothetical protein
MLDSVHCPQCQDSYTWLQAVPAETLSLQARLRFPGCLVHERRWWKEGIETQVVCTADQRKRAAPPGLIGAMSKDRRKA